MADVELTEVAVADLEELIATHELPDDTPERVGRSLRSLRLFPQSGAQLDGRWAGTRFILGPWRWMVLVYAYVEVDDRVIVVAVRDARSSSSPTK